MAEMIEINGKEYTPTQAFKMLDIRKQRVYGIMKRNGVSCETAIEMVLENRLNPMVKEMITINGKEYTKADALKILNIPPQTAYYYMKHKNVSCETAIEMILEKRSKTIRKEKDGIHVTIRGKEFKSKKDAANYYNLRVVDIHHMMKRNNSTFEKVVDYYIEKQALDKWVKDNLTSEPLVIRGEKYRVKYEIINKYKINQAAIRERMQYSNTSYENAVEYILRHRELKEKL